MAISISNEDKLYILKLFPVLLLAPALCLKLFIDNANCFQRRFSFLSKAMQNYYMQKII